MILRGIPRPDLLLKETLYDILSSTAAAYPAKTALVWQDTRLNYQQLHTTATHAAAALSFLGAGPGEVVGLWLPRGADLIVAQCAITGSGAAWLPLDADTPVDRATACLKAASALGLLTTRRWTEKLEGLPVPVWFIEDLFAPAAQRKALIRPAHNDPAYVIYTSGSTGTPKGITITQRNICHLLRSENAVLGIHSEDHVYQGFSGAFDMSFEEIWISFLVGASLWVAPPEVVTDPEAIAETLKREHITVLHAVPTLVALLDSLPTHLRLLNIGGEACPEALAQRLTNGERRVFNTYGPTETTVTASVTELRAGERVTIGLPLPNYGMVVVDAHFKPLPAGETGEIAIFGPGVSPGYLGQPELTAARFIPNPAAESDAESILYLTGDLGLIGEDGKMHCFGRVDHQVKLRGFRIELDEVAAVLARQPGIGTAAAVVREWNGAEEIVAFCVAGESAPDGRRLREAMQRELPAYMVPARIESLREMPRLVSGKIDLSTLRSLPLDTAAADSETTAFIPQTEAMRVLWNELASLFPQARLLPEQDFFNALGGHSLLAARLVSRLRKCHGFEASGVRLIYENRTLGKIAAALSQLSGEAPLSSTRHTPAPNWKRFCCGILQLLCLPLLTSFNLLQWLAPFFTYHNLTGSKSDSIPLAMLASIAVYLLVISLSFPVSAFLRRVLAGRLRPGVYPLWGGTYFRWWLGNQLANVSAGHLISGTQWKALHLRLLGAKIGSHTTFNSLTVSVPELLEIGDGACVGTFANIENGRVEGGFLKIGKVSIGKNASVDSYAVLENDTHLGEGSRLCGLSSLAEGESIPPGQTWSGAPARPIENDTADWPESNPQGGLKNLAEMAFYGVVAAGVAVLFFMPTFPAFVLVDWIDAHTIDLFESALPWWKTLPFFFFMALPSSMGLVLLTAFLAGGLLALMQPQRAGMFPLSGPEYRRKWVRSTVLDTSLQVLHGLYASVFAAPWLRLLGAKVGKGTEVSTAEGVIPHLLELGHGAFIADGALLGDEEQRCGWMRLKGTTIGNRSFVGNGAYVPDGTVFPDDVLLGVQSAAPPNESLQPQQTWMGSPPLLLPARETIALPDAALTFQPSNARRLIRAAIEAVRIVLPMSFVISAGYVMVYQLLDVMDSDDRIGTAMAITAASVLYATGSFLLVCALKWLLVGRYKPRQAPMWTLFVWLSEAVTVVYESLAVPVLLDHLKGTPFLPWALRCLGARIGEGVWMNTTDLTEFDCVEIGDHAELNAHSGPQTHLFEDRIMRIGRVKIGAGATLGVRTTVLYDSSIGTHCRLGPLTLIAKGEQLPPETRWSGSPATASRMRPAPPPQKASA
jgi:non-ribosomal peptide synthetase-like protein